MRFICENWRNQGVCAEVMANQGVCAVVVEIWLSVPRWHPYEDVAAATLHVCVGTIPGMG